MSTTLAGLKVFQTVLEGAISCMEDGAPCDIYLSQEEAKAIEEFSRGLGIPVGPGFTEAILGRLLASPKESSSQALNAKTGLRVAEVVQRYPRSVCIEIRRPQTL